MNTIICYDCQRELPFDCFAVDLKKPHGRNTQCKDCKKKYDRLYRQNNRHKRYIVNKKWRDNNVDHLKKYYEENKEHITVRKRNYMRVYEKNRKAADPSFKMMRLMRQRVRQALKGLFKSKHTIELVGCTPLELKEHIQSQFKEGMTWDNHGYGPDKWHIDHIVPCAAFDLSDPVEQQQCFHYTNLQPMWQEDNMKKSDSWIV